ncbi:PREDICTED: disease resistance protein RPP8-like [Nelumbo nucifera]|uniref:Disease resistance protein RPP8-like n=2 Tax=Nelumbo nucifera TaxID=4432 RepID=A0A1U8AF09_NELNU|nr:PREDICTED: disease resistance protein RPP8-like [Nelumbo nucifera]DAD35194.1 TPA_asm: hypothetical protein HUJ06_005834 [Nelumbo nucifera]
MADVRDVAYDADDIIDGFIFKGKHQRKKGLINFVERYCFVLNELIARHRVNKKIEGIKMRIQAIAESRSTYGIENIGIERINFASRKLHEKRKSSPYVNEEDIVGLEEDVKILQARLLGGESRRSVISIVGMGGLGKTTLAKKVYNSSDIKKHFDCLAWVYISQEHRVEEILQDMGKRVLGLGKVEMEKMIKKELEEMLSTFLEDRRYLVVIDDIWKIEVWNDLQAIFPDRTNGSRVMFTSRFKGVALLADPRSPPHELHFLNDEEGWVLLSKKVFVRRNTLTSFPLWLEEIGKQIVRKCGGLPLAISVLGGLLSTKDETFGEWMKVLQSVHWQLTNSAEQCSEILALSYNELPFYLKPCFLYVDIFPEGYEISARRLTLLWIAEGFVQQRGDEPLEDVAEDYLEELIGRNMIQLAKRKYNGRVKTCCVHNLLRDLAISKSKEDKFLDFFHGGTKVGSIIRACRLAVHLGVPPLNKDTPHYRSLFCFDLGKPIFSEIVKFKLLRVLDLEGVYMPKLDNAFGNLVHLRYLGLSGTWLKKIPSSICNLWNLQTLDIRSTLVNPIPCEIWKMEQLRNLYLNELSEMGVHPIAGDSLVNLQSLQGIFIGGTSCIENALGKLTNLRELGACGDLELQEEALALWIVNLNQLQCLKLEAISRAEGRTRFRVPIPTLMPFSNHMHLCKLNLKGLMKKLLDPDEFPPNLTELSLQDSFLMQDPMETLQKLRNLRILKLKRSSYMGKVMIFSTGGFPQLQLLKLSFLNALEECRINERAMRNLRQLEVIECRRLKFVPQGLRPLTAPCELKLGYMPHKFEMKAQEHEGNVWYKIQHVPPL